MVSVNVPTFVYGDDKLSWLNYVEVAAKLIPTIYRFMKERHTILYRKDKLNK
jgi:hypothetical protein